ncbi:MAG: PLP-dependent aminotransferase family protein [Oscillospiraceae bacterium]|nr:PLP-dependent aminotransferase family protein [Oscillospiraceae bacterium]
MLTYELKKAPGLPLYESLYRSIRGDILSGKLRPGEKLPSKRALAEHLEVSKITVETAYNQLLSEGYICSREKVGYFVEAVERAAPVPPAASAAEAPRKQEPVLDLTGGGTERFPFSVWMKCQREVMLDYGEKLLLPLPNRGIPELRTAIAEHLAAFRGLHVDPENILIGAGTDFLYNLLIQLLGRELVYAVEEPGYGKIRRIYAAGGVRSVSAPMDGDGVIPEALGDARVLHISPSHHFPTGLVTTLQRRLELLNWAQEHDGWIIEDDYDSEFRFAAHPMRAMQELDRNGRVIYMNTFSKTLAPSIRISYLVLPRGLMEQFQKRLGFYSCTVPSFEQYTLARFLHRGHFEKHINRMRKFYRNRRNLVMGMIESSPYADKLTILEQDAGLHFLVRVDTELPDEVLTEKLEQAGLRVRSLSSYYHDDTHRDSHCLVVNYSGVREDQLEELPRRLQAVFG